MKVLIFLIFIFSVLWNTSCDTLLNNDSQTVDCNNLQKGLIDLDSFLVNTEVNKLTKNLEAHPSENDPLGQRENLDKLVESLNVVCAKMTADLICYACYESNPPQSAIMITADSSGAAVYRKININTPADDVLSCVSVQRYFQ